MAAPRADLSYTTWHWHQVFGAGPGWWWRVRPRQRTVSPRDPPVAASGKPGHCRHQREPSMRPCRRWIPGCRSPSHRTLRAHARAPCTAAVFRTW